MKTSQRQPSKRSTTARTRKRRTRVANAITIRKIGDDVMRRIRGSADTDEALSRRLGNSSNGLQLS